MADDTILVTFFEHASARFKSESQLTIGELVEMLESEHAQRKDMLRWLKLARFGSLTSGKASLRHDANVQAVSGVEADYDLEQMAIETAVELLTRAGVQTIVYTSPSHRPDKPRFRVLAPFSQLLPPSERSHMAARLNGVLGGVIAAESFTLSQSYYFGFLTNEQGEPLGEHKVIVVDGVPIDQLAQLDQIAIGKAGKKQASGNGGTSYSQPGDEYVETGELLRRLTTGESWRPSVTTLAGRFARNGWEIKGLKEIVAGAMSLANRPDFLQRVPQEFEAIDWCYRQEARKPENQSNKPPPPTTLYRFTALKGRTFMPLQWLVPNYIPEGLTLLAGKPKIGKSWLALACVCAMARNEVVLDQICPRRDVIYFALEDNPRRMRNRAEIVLGASAEWPDNVLAAHDLANLDNGCIGQLEQIHLEHPSVSVMIIDTLVKVRGKRLKDEDQYGHDYRTLNALYEFARRSGVAIIVIHHVRKQTAEDIFDTISGTHGLSAAADTLMVLTRAGDQLRLAVRGRDLEPEDKVVDFDALTGAWTIVGDYEGDESATTIPLAVLLAALSAKPSGLTPADAAKVTGLPADTVRQALRRMAKAQRINHTQYGTYEAKTTTR